MRRWLAPGLVVAALAGALVASAQPAGRTVRVGFLCAIRCGGPALDAFRDGLKELGWVESRNLILETRAAGGHFDRLPALAREIVDLKPDVFVASSPQPSRAAKDAAGGIPLVFVGVAERKESDGMRRKPYKGSRSLQYPEPGVDKVGGR